MIKKLSNYDAIKKIEDEIISLNVSKIFQNQYNIFINSSTHDKYIFTRFTHYNELKDIINILIDLNIQFFIDFKNNLDIIIFKGNYFYITNKNIDHNKLFKNISNDSINTFNIMMKI